ncbi:MAG: hypothetical protein ABID84_01960 [Chloroflexota bacterium]
MTQLEASERKISRRKLLVRGTVLAGATLAGLYVKPNLMSVGVPAAYAQTSPVGDICITNHPPSVTVIHPNIWAVYHVGEVMTIEWTANDLDGVSNLKPLIVSIYFDNGWDEPRTYDDLVIATGIVQDSPGTHSYNWLIPANPVLYSSKCKVRIVVEDQCGAVADDESDNVFCPPPPA